MVGSGRGQGGAGGGGGYYYSTLQAVSLSASLSPHLFLPSSSWLLLACSPHSTPAHLAFAAAVAPAPSNPPCARATGREQGSCARTAYCIFPPGSNCPCLASGSGVRPRFVLGALAAAASPPPTLSAPTTARAADLFRRLPLFHVIDASTARTLAIRRTGPFALYSTTRRSTMPRRSTNAATESRVKAPYPD